MTSVGKLSFNHDYRIHFDICLTCQVQYSQIKPHVWAAILFTIDEVRIKYILEQNCP